MTVAAEHMVEWVDCVGHLALSRTDCTERMCPARGKHILPYSIELVYKTVAVFLSRQHLRCIT